MRTKSNKTIKPIALIIAWAFVIISVFSVAVAKRTNSAYANPDWLNDYKVAMSFEEARLVTTKTTAATDNTVTVKIFCGIPSGVNINEIKVKIRTRNGTAVAGQDYTAFDDVVTLRRSNGSGGVYYDTVSIKVNRNLERFVVNDNYPYFDVELYEVLTENFSAQDNAKSLRVSLVSATDKMHSYLTNNQLRRQILSAYSSVSSSTYNNLEIYHEDKSGQTLTASQAFKDNGTGVVANLGRDYIDTGFANLYVGGNCELDESGVTMTSWCTLKLYDGSTSGTQLYTVTLRHIDEDTLTFGQSYGDMKHDSESFANSDYVFKAQNALNWSDRYYMKVASRTLYETFKSDSNYWRKTYNWNLNWIAVDESTPKIKGWYVDQSTLRSGDKIRISVRFNEPVNASSMGISDVKLRTRLSGTGGFNDYAATFNCVSSLINTVGEGNWFMYGLATDTLIFEFDPSDAKDQYGNALIGTINNIEIEGFDNINKIFDYGRNRNDENNYCKNYTTLALLEADKCAPRQVRSSLSLSFDNRSPIVEQNGEIPGEYVKSYSTTISTAGTDNFAGAYYLWSASPDVNYVKVENPADSALDDYYEITDGEMRRTSDLTVDENKTYYIYRKTDLAKIYEYEHNISSVSGEADKRIYRETLRYKDMTPFTIGYSSSGNFETTLEGVSGVYYLHVYAKADYSDESGTFRRFGPVLVDNDAPQSSQLSVTGNVRVKDVSVRIDDISGLKNVILYLSESRFDAGNASEQAAKLLVYGTTDDESVSTIGGFETKYENGVLTFKIYAEEHLGLKDEYGAQAYGDYYIGLVATDLVGNVTDILSSETAEAFDTRDLFAPFVKIDGVTVTENGGDYLPVIDKVTFYAENAYVVDISSGAKTIAIGKPGLSDAADGYYISNIYKIEHDIRIPLAVYENGAIGQAGKIYFTDYAVRNNGGVNAEVSFVATVAGYYEITTRASLGTDEFYSQTQRFYVTDGNAVSQGVNYNNIFNVGVNFKNKLFALGSARFYMRTGTGMGSSVSAYYNDSAEPVVFSDREKAADYVKAMEYRDLYAVRLTQDDVRAFNNGTLTTDREETRRPAVGEIWIRYKAATWNFSTAQRDWTYYYYGGTSSSIVIDVNEFSSRLSSVIDQVVNAVIQRGGDLYINSMTGTSESGALYLDPVRIPSSFEVTSSAGTPSTQMTYGGDGSSPLKYTFDKNVFYDKYNDKDKTTLISAYKFEYLNSTKIYYAPAKTDSSTGEVLLETDSYKYDFKLLTTPYLTQSVSGSGVYVIRELDENGMHDYSVYVDKDDPTMIVQYADIDSGHTMNYNVWLNRTNDGDTLHTTEFTIQLIEDKEFSDTVTYNDYHAFGVDADTYTYVAVFELTYGERTFVKGFSLKDLAAVDSAYELPYGVFEIELYDRAGNGFKMTVSRSLTPLDTVIEIVEDDNITYMIRDRIPSEIESVYVTRPGQSPELIDFVAQAEVFTDSEGRENYGLRYTDAGIYEFTVTDKYGYTISPATDADPGKNHSFGELTRVNPYENVKWVTRTDDGRFVDLDEADINLFKTDNYYITSDEKLSFVLDSTTTYSYVFTGNVTATATERVIGGKTYVYVNVDSSERWSVKIYYTLYPDIFVTFNRIAKRAVVPAAINLRPAERDSVGIAQADTSNRVVVYVGTQDEVVDPITVTLRTRDKSAIAELGDYDAYVGTVTLTSSVREQMVVIQTHPSGFSTYNSATYQYASRTFELYVDSIEGNAEKGKSSVECACPGAQELNVTQKDGILTFEDYLSGAKYGLENVVLEQLYSSSATGRYYDKNYDFSVSKSWMSTYINTGIANVYLGLKLSVSGSHINGYPDLRLTLTDVSNNSQLARVFVNNLEENKNIFLGHSYDGLTLTNETYDKNTSIVLGEMRGVAAAGRYFLMPVGSKGNIRFNVYESEGMYITYAYGGGGMASPIYNYIVPARNLNDVVAYGILVDNKAPTVQSWHIDHNTVHVGEKLRLSVRFSEPVYVSGKAPIITANVSNSLTTIDFVYAGGAGTDTLYFEFDPSLSSTEVNVDSVTIASATNFGSICDYGYNASKRNNFAEPTIIPPRNSEWNNTCSLDTRKPVIETDGSYNIPIDPQRSASVPVVVTRVASGAEMEYSWTVETEAPAMYDKKLTVNSSQQRVNIETSGLSGTYYLHVYMKSVYGKVSTSTIGPFLFDNKNPTISGLMVEEATKSLKERNVVFYIKDEPFGDASSGIAQVYLYYLLNGIDPQTILLYDVEKDESKSIIKIPDNNRVTFVLNYEDLGIPKETQRDVTMAIYAVDGLGNAPNISGYTFCPTVVNFDSRSEVEVEMTSNKAEFFNADGRPVFNILGSELKLDFSFSRQADEYDIRQLFIGGKQIDKERFGEYLEYTADGDGAHVVFKKNVVGLVRINFKAVSGINENRNEQDSSDVVFYLTSGVNLAETANYLATYGGTLLINKVYILDTSIFYYHNGEGVRQLNYNDTTRLMSFSSRDKAVEYVRYFEMQDLSVMEIKSASVASSLNTGDGSYRKAAADASVVASVGQVWIRYKRATWDNATTPEAWVYYYYGTSSEIDPERLPASLLSAISQVTDTIVDRGGYVYLTSADGNLDANGSPYLHPAQIKTERLTTFVTLTGAEMRSAVTFSGDPDIYDSEVETGGGEVCSLVTTYQFYYGEYTKLFYTNKTDSNGNPIDREFKLLPEGTVFGSLDIDGGVYWMRECDENGVRDFKVYLDKTAPTVNIAYENARGDVVERELDASVDGMSINGKTLTIVGFSSSVTEIDAMSYIAVFRKNGVLLEVYRKEDIPSAGIGISEGQYILEISDRSGNAYRVSLSLNSTPMTVRVAVEDNRYIRISCNRDASEIKNFEIYLDGKLIESNYASTLTYYQAGVYSIRVEDWFGNTYSYDCELKRDLPQLNWYYEEADAYISYDGSQSCIKISKTGEREYQIVTNKILMFTFDTSADYTYEFSDGALSYTVREFNGFTRIRINDAVDWTVTVRYARYPDIYVVYNCVTDRSAPIINVTARQDVVTYFDARQFESANIGTTADSDEYFIPDTIYFAVNKTISKAVRENSVVYSPLITLQFTDKSICNEVEVYLDGVLIREFSESEGVNNVTVTRFGEYRIVARDTLGNESQFFFTNDVIDDAHLFVDGQERDMKLSPADSIVYENGEYSYEPDVYAYDSIEMEYDGSATVVVMIEKNGERKYLRFESVNGALYEVKYKLVAMTDELGEPVYDYNDEPVYIYRQIYSSTIVADVNSVENGTSYVLAKAEEVGADVSVRFEDGKVFYSVDAPEDGEATVMIRVTYDAEYQPYFVKAVMCGELPKITLQMTDEDGRSVTPASTEEMIYLNGEFFIAETDFRDITEITVAYSETTDFTDYQVVYTNDRGYETLLFGEEGFYSVVVRNVYGREAEFTVILSNELRVVVTAEYYDGEYNVYSARDGESFKSNDSVTIDVYFERVTYVLTYNGVTNEPVTLRDPSGTCSAAFRTPGVYSMVITDDFENEVRIDFEIKDVPFEFKTGYLNGYNEKALRVDEGYTNNKLSVNAEAMIADGLLQAVLVYNDERFVVFDLLKANVVSPSGDRIDRIVGASGDGVYTLVMRNAYGNVTQTVIHYMGTPALNVSRLIRTSRDPEPIGITEGALNKLYSNLSVTFETVAGLYEMRIDGNRADMPLVVSYPTDGEEAGEYVKTVTYIDEYGFEYEFEINLVRKTLEVNLADFMDIVTINDVVMTQGNVMIELDPSVTCEVARSGGERVPYTSGDVLTADGTYRFYITDIAGNVFTATVRKDTLVEFTFLNSATDRTVENGGVINEGYARFMPVNSDSARIELVVLNGEEYDMATSVGFGASGKWEFIISDDIGNKSYYYFYVIPHSLAFFEYDSPYGYKITDVQYDDGDGVLVSYISGVLQYTYRSKMIFSESGSYFVTVSSLATAAQFSFAVAIDKTPPKAKLVGVENGGSTTKTVTIADCKTGEVVRIYKDGELTQTSVVTSDTMKLPEIREQGDYKIVITNDAGNEQVFEFTRRYTANLAMTITVIVTCLLIATGLLVVLIMRKRMKV